MVKKRQQRNWQRVVTGDGDDLLEEENLHSEIRVYTKGIDWSQAWGAGDAATRQQTSNKTRNWKQATGKFLCLV